MKKTILDLGKITFLLFAVAAVLLVGCGQNHNANAAKAGEGQEAGNEEAEGKAGNEEAGGKEAGNEEVGSKDTDDKAEADKAKIAFEGQDLEGNVVTSEIFSSSKLTMVNVWATYCNPCLREMPGLGELAGEFDLEEFQILGIISDVEEGADAKMKDFASDLVEQTGADYTHLLVNVSLYNALLTDVSAVPTTFFFDREGNLLDTVIGSMDKAAWEEQIHALLETQ